MDSPEANPSVAEPASGLETTPETQIDSRAAAIESPVAQTTAAGAMALRPYDFRRPAFLSPNESRKLHSEYEEFLLRLGTRLTNYLRLEVELKVQSIETFSFYEFTQALPVPTHLTLFKIEPLRGICVIELSSILGLAIFDRLMGGTGQAPADGRELSEIEAALIDHVIRLILDDWCASCAKTQSCKPVLLGHETDGRYLQTSPPASKMFVVCVEVNLAQLTGRIQMAFPFSTLEPSIRQLREELKGPAEPSSDLITPRPLQWNKALEDLKVSVTAELPPLQTPARKLTWLKVGDTLPLPAEFANRVEMRLAGMLRFTGRLGTRDGRWAIEVTNISMSRSVA
jgi:flagellar motor switch protein FliM